MNMTDDQPASGGNQMQEQRDRLLYLLDSLCLDVGHTFKLSTGTSSSFYFDCKKATLNGECLALIADAFLKEIDSLPSSPSGIAGLTIGADFIVAAVILRAHQTGHSTVHGSIVRKEPKKHGTRNFVENELPSGTKVVMVDDVITTGMSTERACDGVLALGYEMVGIVGLVDREAGGAGHLKNKFGCPVRSIFKKRDFPRIKELERVAHS